MSFQFQIVYVRIAVVCLGLLSFFLAAPYLRIDSRENKVLISAPPYLLANTSDIPTLKSSESFASVVDRNGTGCSENSIVCDSQCNEFRKLWKEIEQGSWTKRYPTLVGTNASFLAQLSFGIL